MISRVLVVGGIPVLRLGVVAALQEAGYLATSVAGFGGSSADVMVFLDAEVPWDVVTDAGVVLLAGPSLVRLALLRRRGRRLACLPLDAEPEELVEAVRRVAAGQGYLHPAMMELALSAGRGERTGLSRREAEVARLVAAGCRNREIAARLFIAEKTVKQHVGAVFRKLGARNRVEAALAWREAEGGGDQGFST